MHYYVRFLQIRSQIVTSEPMQTTSKEMVPSTPVINYCLKNEVSIMLHCQTIAQHHKSRTV